METEVEILDPLLHLLTALRMGKPDGESIKEILAKGSVPPSILHRALC